MKTDEFRRRLEIEPLEDGPDPELECYMTELAEMTDLEELCEIDEFVADNPARRKMIEEAIQKRQCWLVADDSQVLAYGIFDYSFKNQGLVKLVHVHVDYRRQGVGAEMLMTFESTCESRKIYAAVPLNNLAAQELVQRVGYIPLRGEAFRGPLDDPRVIYVKDLYGPPRRMHSETIQ